MANYVSTDCSERKNDGQRFFDKKEFVNRANAGTDHEHVEKCLDETGQRRSLEGCCSTIELHPHRASDRLTGLAKELSSRSCKTSTGKLAVRPPIDRRRLEMAKAEQRLIGAAPPACLCPRRRRLAPAAE
jgi:hypothetical protein